MPAMPPSPCIRSLKFETDAGPGERARIGLIVLQSDQTIEPEFASLLRGLGVVLYHARIPNAMEVTPDTLRQMERELPGTVRLLPREFCFDAIGYCCTSGAAEIGGGRSRPDHPPYPSRCENQQSPERMQGRVARTRVEADRPGHTLPPIGQHGLAGEAGSGRFRGGAPSPPSANRMISPSPGSRRTASSMRSRRSVRARIAMACS